MIRRAARSERGVAIVEAAFVTPVFLLLVLGLIEGGLYMNDYLGVANSVRAGARASSAMGSVGDADLFTVVNVSKESAALRDEQIDYIVVYKATGFGAKPTATCQAGTSVTGVCNVFRRADIRKAVAQLEEESAQAEAEAQGITRVLDQSKIWFGCLTSGPNANQSPDRFWCPSGRADAQTANGGLGPDYVGVYVKAQHPWTTKIFGNETTLTDQSVIQIEPRTE
jgi:Flp pilus assembly protein TadG